jgi:hypothetical protein
MVAVTRMVGLQDTYRTRSFRGYQRIPTLLLLSLGTLMELVAQDAGGDSQVDGQRGLAAHVASPTDGSRFFQAQTLNFEAVLLYYGATNEDQKWDVFLNFDGHLDYVWRVHMGPISPSDRCQDPKTLRWHTGCTGHNLSRTIQSWTLEPGAHYVKFFVARAGETQGVALETWIHFEVVSTDDSEEDAREDLAAADSSSRTGSNAAEPPASLAREEGDGKGGVYVSFVMVGRVDTLRGDYVGRLRNSVQFIQALSRLHKVSSEIVIVEWNPLGGAEAEAESLADALRPFVESGNPPLVRVITGRKKRQPTTIYVSSYYCVVH